MFVCALIGTARQKLMYDSNCKLGKKFKARFNIILMLNYKILDKEELPLSRCS